MGMISCIFGKNSSSILNEKNVEEKYNKVIPTDKLVSPLKATDTKPLHELATTLRAVL